MYNTNDIKARQEGLFTVGSTSPDALNVLIVASCRGVPHLNYLNRYNEAAGRPMRITYINPNDYSWDARGHPQDLQAKLLSLETDARVLAAIRECDLFIHEHHENFGMFNTSTERSEKSVWHFGMDPGNGAICLPNFHNHFILAADVMQHELKASQVMIHRACLGEASDEIQEFIRLKSVHHVNRFVHHCNLSSFPEFGEWFKENWQTTRLFWTFNHVSAAFTLEMFRRMNSRFLRLPLDGSFWHEAGKEDMFQYPQTQYTSLDRTLLGVRW